MNGLIINGETWVLMWVAGIRSLQEPRGMWLKSVLHPRFACRRLQGYFRGEGSEVLTVHLSFRVHRPQKALVKKN